ncbi:MAG: Calx-beta domain-containing protein, partial [Pyrinomonadaceae bacterium]
SLDTTFGGVGVITNYDSSPAAAVAVQADGKYVVGAGGLQRVNPDGTLDYSLRVQNYRTPTGFIRNTVQSLRDLKLLPNGKIVVAGAAGVVDILGNSTGSNFEVAVHNPDGTFDLSFGQGGIATTDIDAYDAAFALAVDGHNRVVAAGSADNDLAVAAYQGASAQFAVGFGSATFRTHESAGAATITVALGAPVGQPVTVDYATSDGTATAGSDYTPVSGTLTFAPGETAKTFDVPVTSDAVGEQQGETVLLTLSNVTNAALTTVNPATLEISDNPSLHAGTISTLERAGVATVSVYLSAPSQIPVTVDYSTSDGTATAGDDYTPTAGTLTFAPGQKTQTVDVPLTRDSNVEPEETFLFTLSNPTNAGVSVFNPATITILDNTITCAGCGNFVVGERESTAHVAVTISEDLGLFGTVTVNYSTSDGTATAGDDYLPVSGTLTFGPGNRGKPPFTPQTQIISIPVHSDLVYDPDETIVVSLSSTAELTTGPLALVKIVDASIVVNSFEQNGGDCTLSLAIQAANTDRQIGGCEKGDGTDVIFVPAGTYTLTSHSDYPFIGPVGLAGITTDVRIQGAGPESTIIERDPAAPAFGLMAITNQNGGSLVLSNLTMRGGRTTGSGGALFTWGRPATLDNVTFTDNAAGTGGAASAGPLVVNNCTFQN